MTIEARPDPGRASSLPEVIAMERYDVIVVGARPAGAATAMLLARWGHRVLVLDRMQPGSDTLSTHALMRTGVLQLERWGLLDGVIHAGTPPVHRVTFHYGTETVPIDVRQPLYAPRRTVLDPVLADAAIRAGAEVRFGARVRGLLRADGRVVGVYGTTADGVSFTAAATVVVGADGRTSLVAREVDAPTTHRGRASGGTIYAYWKDVDVDGYHWSFVPGSMAGAIPTNDGLTCVFVSASTGRFLEELRTDLNDAIPDVLAQHDPALAERIMSGRRVTPPHGFAGIAGWLRRPHGAGWALVGDAGYFKDPSTAHGISDALRDAEYLARAVDAGLRGHEPLTRTLAGYERTRDEQSLALLRATEVVAAFDWSLAQVQRAHLDLSEAMKQEVAALTALPPAPLLQLAVA
jgi:flavin-dependent dehydrogenase